jgi:predicted DNA-binding protein YlxM (UPF0122 family)
MAVKKEQRIMTKQEHNLRVMMQRHRVSQSEIADHEDISISAVGMRLKSLTPSMVTHFENLILDLSKSRQKVAS